MATPIFINSRSPVAVQASRMATIEDRLQKLDKQIATGERILEPSDDPAGANRAAMLVRAQGALDARKTALDLASSRLSGAENRMRSASDVILRARDLALAAANGTSGETGRTVTAQEVKILKEQLLEIANSQDHGGHYLFGGASNAARPYVAGADGSVSWQGFGTTAGAEAAGLQGAAVPAGPALFGDDASGAFAQLDALVLALEQPDAELRTQALATSLSALENANDRLIMSQALVGAGMARMEAEIESVEAARLSVKEDLAKIAGVDLTAAFTEVQALRLSLSASQASFTSLFDGSLFDRIG